MSPLSTLAIENNRRLSREAKRRRRGTCVDCGSETKYSGAPNGGVSPRCKPCADESQRWKRGRGVFVEAALAEMRERPCRAADIARVALIDEGYARVMLHRLLTYGLIERVERGLYRAVAPAAESRGGA